MKHSSHGSPQETSSRNQCCQDSGAIHSARQSNRRRLFGAVALILHVCILTGCARLTSTLKASAYYDTRELLSGTVTTSVTDARHGTRFFAFSDMENDSKFPRYVEAQLTQRIVGRVGAVAEYNRDFNAPKGTERFGLTYLLPLPQAFKNDRFALKYTPYSTHGRGAQFSIAGSKLIGPDMSIDGFFDYNLKPDVIVTDWQFGRRLVRDVYGVIEYRHSGLRRDSDGVGIGLEWRIR